MIRLVIDGADCCVRSSSTISLNYSVTSLEDLNKMSEGEQVRILIPSTPNNDDILCENGYTHSPQRFNSTPHRAEVWSHGERLFEGDALIERVVWQDGEMWYSILITTQRAQWATDARANVFNKFNVDFEMFLTTPLLKEQWASDDPVKFVEVRRDTYKPEESSVSNEVVRDIAALEDYHPFLHIASMMNSIFETSGYRVQSQFMESDYFKSLYMSGSYGSSTNSVATSTAMDFYVKRYEDATATANWQGRVYMTPNYVANSIGAIVDAETANTESDCYSYGGCFTEKNGIPTFTPLTQVYVGFAVRLRYVTPYKIVDRDSLQAFNKVYLCSGHDYEFTVANKFTDQRESLNSAYSYMLCLFDHEPGDESYLYFRAEDDMLTFHSRITDRVTYITTPSSAITEAVLLDGNGEDYHLDWAIYWGYVQEEGSTEVDVTLRITPEQRSPTSPMSFSNLYIYGAEAGWEITVKAESCITPYFAKHPGTNTSITFADIAQVDSFQSSLVESIAHMYNLRMWTDDANKVVYVEPYDDMWDYSTTWDWSDKIDWSSSISMSDLSAEVYRNRKWGYRDGDGVTSRGDGDIPPDDEFGFWECEIESHIAKEGTESLLSPLYSPSQSTDKGILQVGDRDDVERVNTFDFTPRIVRHEGDIAYDGYMMPRMAFYNPDDGVSLCFEDRGGVEGLNRYYTRQIALEERGRVLSLHLRLSAHDVASLFSPSEVAPHILSLFRFTLHGEQVTCLLKEVEEYDPQRDSTLCRFIVVD